MKKHNLTFISLCIYISLLILLPKNLPNLFGVLPIRTGLTYLLFLIFIYDRYKNKIALNNINFKWLGITYGIFILFTIPSLITTRNMLTSIYTIFKFISCILLLYVCLKTKFTKDEYRKIIILVIGLSTLKFIWGLIEYIFGINLFTIGSYKYPGSKGRVRAFFFNTIYYGVYINMIYLYIYYLFNKTLNKTHKIILGIILILGYINMLLTFTRSTFLIFFGIIFLLFVCLRKRFANRYTFGILIICLVTLFIIPGTKILMLSSLNDVCKMVFKVGPFERFLPKEMGIEDDAEMGDYSLAHRKLFAKTGIAIGKDNPLTGVGFGSFIDYIKTDDFANKYPQFSTVKTHPHSSYILLFSETGFLTVVAFTTFMITIFVKLIKNIKGKKEINDIAIITLCMTIGFYMVNIIAENIIYDTQVFPMYLIVLGLSLNYIEKDKV